MDKQSIDYNNQDFFLGIDVHRKNWIVTIRTNHMELVEGLASGSLL